jgi:hypothetical protein
MKIGKFIRYDKSIFFGPVGKHSIARKHENQKDNQSIFLLQNYFLPISLAFGMRNTKS